MTTLSQGRAAGRALMAALVLTGLIGGGLPAAADDPLPPRWSLFNGRSTPSPVQWTCHPMPTGEAVAQGFSTRETRSGSALVLEVRFLAPDFWGGITVSTSCGPAGWGKEAGPALDLSRYHRLVLHAKGADGGEVVAFKSGLCNTEAFGDSVELPLTVADDDGRGKPLPTVTLSTEWQPLVIPLQGDLSHMVCLLGVSASRDSNRGRERIKFYLDDVYLE